MVEMDTLAGKIFSLLKGNGLKIKIYDEAGAEITDPSLGRRFFVASPNIMVTIDEESNKIEFSKGASVDNSIEGLQKNVRRLADEFLMNSDIKVFGKTIQPRDYAYQAKIKGAAMNENTNTNSHLMGQIVHLLTKTGGGFTADGLVKNIPGTHLGDVQRALNKLVQDGKISADGTTNAEDGLPFYTAAVDEAIMESFSKMFGSLKTSQQTLENVRILVRHKTPVDENIRGARSRHISAIFLECNGERFRFPHNYLPGAMC